METNSKLFEENKKTARLAFEAFEKKDLTLLDRITDPNYKLHFPGSPTPLNYEESKKLQTDYTRAFPDMKITIVNQVAEGDCVVTQMTYTGTHKGELQGVTATGKKVKVTGMSLQKITNGKITEEWAEFDALGMMQQIGAIPEMATQPLSY